MEKRIIRYCILRAVYLKPERSIMKSYWTPMFILLIGVACAICCLPSNLPPCGGLASGSGPIQGMVMALLAPAFAAFERVSWMLDKAIAG